MQTVELDDKEWQQVVAVLASGPWSIVNPILSKLAQQLQMQDHVKGNSKDQVLDSKTQ